MAYFMNKVFLLIGGNLGDRMQSLHKAESLIDECVGQIEKKSSIYETAAWGNTAQPSFLNRVVAVSTVLPAEKVLSTILEIEQKLGRIRLEKMGPRMIDIDILYFNHSIFFSTNLTIPHPQLHNRRFVLVPLTEIAPEYVHPIFQKSNQQLLQVCDDLLEVKKLL